MAKPATLKYNNHKNTDTVTSTRLPPPPQPHIQAFIIINLLFDDAALHEQ